jgi:hypothetical protein
MMEKIVRLATYSNPIDAEMVKHYLQDAGITVFSAGAEAAGAFVGLDSAFANIELHVPQSQLQQALQALESFDEQDSTAEYHLSHEDDTDIMEGEPDRPISPVTTTSQFRSGPPAEEFAGADTDREVGAFDMAPDDPADTVASIQCNPDALAARAWRASFLGMIVLPPLLNLYSIWLLIRLAGLHDEPSPAGLRRVYGAIIINGFVLITETLILLAFLAR